VGGNKSRLVALFIHEAASLLHKREEVDHELAQ
jgi:hypothetical protein